MTVRQQTERLIAETYEPLLAFVQRRVRHRQTAQDIVHTGYASVLARPGFDPARPSAAGYLWRKVTWLVKDHFRSRDRRTAPLPFDRADPRCPSPEQVVEEAEARGALWEAIDGLDEPQATAVTNWAHGVSPKRMARELGMPQSRVYRLLYRARRTLRHRLRRDGQ